MANAAWDSPAKVEAWHRQRGVGIGSSDASAVCGVNPYKTALEVYLHKVAGAPATGRLSDEPAIRFGLILEPAVARAYELQYGVGLVEPEPAIHPDFPWMGATADRIALDSEGKPCRIIEIKTSSSFARGWGEPGTDEIPEMYMIQVQHQLAVYQLDVADVAVLIDGRDFRIYQVERNQAVIDSLIQIEADFWDRVVRRLPPDPDWAHPSTPDLIEELCKPTSGKVIDLGDGANAAIAQYRQLTAAIRDIEGELKAAKSRRDATKAQLIHAMGDAETAMAGRNLITRKTTEVKGYIVKPFSYETFHIKESKK